MSICKWKFMADKRSHCIGDARREITEITEEEDCSGAASEGGGISQLVDMLDGLHCCGAATILARMNNRAYLYILRFFLLTLLQLPPIPKFWNLKKSRSSLKCCKATMHYLH